MSKKIAEQTGKEPKPKFTCMDYTNRSADLPGSPSCIQGTALDTGCPDDKVVATCTLEKTGVVTKYYEGIEKTTPSRMCKTLEGTFSEVK